MLVDRYNYDFRSQVLQRRNCEDSQTAHRVSTSPKGIGWSTLFLTPGLRSELQYVSSCAKCHNDASRVRHIPRSFQATCKQFTSSKIDLSADATIQSRSGMWDLPTESAYHLRPAYRLRLLTVSDCSPSMTAYHLRLADCLLSPTAHHVRLLTVSDCHTVSHRVHSITWSKCCLSNSPFATDFPRWRMTRCAEICLFDVPPDGDTIYVLVHGDVILVWKRRIACSRIIDSYPIRRQDEIHNRFANVLVIQKRSHDAYFSDSSSRR